MGEKRTRKYCYKFILDGFGVTGAHFPEDKYPISDDFILVRYKRNPEKCIACLIEDMPEGDERFSRHIKTEEDMMNFVSIFNLFTQFTLRYKDAGAQTIMNINGIENELTVLELTMEALLTSEQQERERDRILKQLFQTEKLWKLYQEIPNNKLKKNITNSLHYFFYGKTAFRNEEKIVNFITALECLFLSDNRELSYKLSIRSSYLLNRYVELSWDDIFTFIKRMYSARSNVLHIGELKRDINYTNISDLERYVSICLRTYILLILSYNTKQEIIELIEKGIFGIEIELPSEEEINYS